MCLRINSPAISRVGSGAINLHREPRQRMAKVDDRLQRRTKQVVLAVVARLAHGSLQQRISRS